MSTLPPDVRGNAHPHKLLNFEEMTILQEHYRIVSRCRGREERDKELKAKGWTERQRSVANGLYARLFDAGFIVDGQHESGSLYFGVRVKSVLQQIQELSEDDFAAYNAGAIVIDHQSGRLVRRIEKCR